MKNVILSLAAGLLIFSRSVSFGQVNSFIAPSYSAYSTEQTTDNGFIIALLRINFNTTSIIKLDSTGKQTNAISTEVENKSASFVTQTSDGGYVVVGYENDVQVNRADVKVVKLTHDLSVSWTKLFGTSSKNERGLLATKTSDGGYLIFGITGSSLSLTSVKEFYVIKIDSSGNLLWEKYYASPSISLTRPCYSLITTSDGGFLLHGLNQMLKISASGDSLWSKTFSTNYFSCEKAGEGKLVFGGQNSLMLTDENLTEIWTKTFNSTIYSVQQALDNGFILLGTSGLIKTNSAGDTLWSTNFDGLSITGTTIYKVITTKDSGYVVSRDNIFIKTDSRGRVLNLTFPSSTTTSSLYPGVPTNIIWKSSGISKLNIKFSPDGGKSWEPVESNVSSSMLSYPWLTPNLTLESCKIRLSDIDNQIYTQTQNFSISSHINNTAFDYIAANQILMWVGNNGICSHDPRTDGSGFYWPGGLNATLTAIYQDGFIWGGKVDGQIRVGGNVYRSGLQPGKVLSNGIADNPNDPKYSVWKIKKDWEGLPPSEERSKYEYNFNNWPGDLGAPYVDENKDGIYTLSVDKPKFLGDEVLWLVSNDLDASRTNFLYGSNPIGLEVQTTVFAFNRTDELANVVFKNHKIINTSDKPVTDMYLAYWSDPDLGYANDDFVGCDTTLSLGYTYNGDDTDDGFYGNTPPAIGYSFMQGPIVAGTANDSAMFLSQWRRGYKNLPLTAFSFYVNMANTPYRDPDQGVYNGSLQMYNYLQGLIWDGTQYVNPHNGINTKFPLSGDPVLGTGWYEGPVGWPGGSLPPEDRRHLMCSGPFTLAPGDTQEVIIAISIARGTSNLNSITELKKLAKSAKDFYYLQQPNDVAANYLNPTEFALSQNYPNPFNPSTVISYQLPVSSKVSLKIYDLLGREVATLVNEEQSMGWKEVEWNASSAASGIYFYKLQANNFIETKKMLIIK